jgi:hypothetical protein
MHACLRVKTATHNALYLAASCPRNSTMVPTGLQGMHHEMWHQGRGVLTSNYDIWHKGTKQDPRMAVQAILNKLRVRKSFPHWVTMGPKDAFMQNDSSWYEGRTGYTSDTTFHRPFVLKWFSREYDCYHTLITLIWIWMWFPSCTESPRKGAKTDQNVCPFHLL